MEHFLFQEILWRGGKKLKLLSLQNYIIQENLTIVFVNSKYKQNLRTVDRI
jgi:hypothetical protein